MLLPSSYLKACNTDKTYETHHYEDLYDMVFMKLLAHKKKLSILEIGVSLIPNGSPYGFTAMPYVEKYVGIDIDPLLGEPYKGVFIQTDAYTEEGFSKAAIESPFDLIIDDGGHTFEQQTFFFEHYERLLHKNGIMVCEDVVSDCIELLMQKFQGLLHRVDVPANQTRDNTALLRIL